MQPSSNWVPYTFVFVFVALFVFVLNRRLGMAFVGIAIFLGVANGIQRGVIPVPSVQQL